MHVDCAPTSFPVLMMIGRAILFALFVPLLAACGSKNPKPVDKPPPPPVAGQMRDLFPPQPTRPRPAPASAPSTAAAQSSTTPPAGGAAPAAATAAAAAGATQWPLKLSSEGVAFEVHEPVADSWAEGIIAGRVLVVAQPPAAQPVNGFVTFKAITQVNEAAGVVALQDTEIRETSFSAPADKTQAWQEFLRFALPDKMKTVSLKRLEAGQAEAKARQSRAAAEVAVPRIIISEKPAVLVYIDGEPNYVRVRGTDLMGVLNTRVLLLKEPAGTLLLHLYDGWVSATSLDGPWTMVPPPPGARELEARAVETGHAKLLTGKADAQGNMPHLSNANLPRIIVSTEPAALIVLDGAPRFEPITGTSLEYATNTSAHLFKDERGGLYVRVGGNWFRAPGTDGPWTHIPIASLPPGFSKIPDDSPKASVKGSIAKAMTPPAWQVSSAKPGITNLTYSLGGDPLLKPIRGTQLNYVANASVPMIQVDINNWYAVQEGVWFRASEATGPWTVTRNIPPEIYAIPPTTPIYHAIQSRAISSSTDEVYYGYPTTGSLLPEGGATGVEEQGADYQYTPPSSLYWGWFY
ncbi:MAG TPA: hypothetical protein VEK05_04315 [Burkholderiales bacterium]|nr:hypothetical protein [Burkholderiales bacterium]